MKGVGIALGAAVVAIGGIASTLLRDSRATSVALLHGQTDESLDERASDRTSEDTSSTDAARAAQSIAADLSVERELDLYGGDGSILLRIVDGESEAPLADLPFVVWNEGPPWRVFTRAVTDANGEATIDRLPEAVILVETQRRPPHANTTHGTCLRRGERKRVTIRVGRGGMVHGRVIDDLGRPLAGVDVEVDPRPGGSRLAWPKSVRAVDPNVARRFDRSSLVVGTTDAEGRYEIAALRSRPVAIEIEDGEMRAKREDKVEIRFRWRRALQEISTLVAEGETVELRDVLIERARTFSGRVVDDSSGEPIAGALVTKHARRTYGLGERPFDQPRFTENRQPAPDALLENPFELAPWELGFVLAEDEAVTGPDGAFELASSTEEGKVLVVAPDQRRKSFDLPKVEPGGRTADVELRLPAETQLLLELTESDGNPIESPLGGKWPLRFALQITGVTRDGRQVETSPRLASPMLVGTRFEVDPGDLARIVVKTPYHRSAVHEFTSPPAGRPRLRFELQRKGSYELKLRFRFANEEERRLLGDRHLSVGVCAQPWTGTPSGLEWEADRGWFDHALFQPRESLDVVLRVPTRRAWHVVVNGPFGDQAEFDRDRSVEVGAFAPDEAPHEVVLPRVSAAKRSRREAPATTKTEPAPRPQPGLLAARVCDAVTGAFIENGVEFLISKDVDGGESPSRHGATSRHALGQRWWTIGHAPGELTVKVRATGYRESGFLTATVQSNEPTNLGEIRLERLPACRIRIVHDDGTTVGAGWEIRAQQPDVPMQLRPSVRTDAAGIATLREELGSIWTVSPPGFEDWRGGEWPATVAFEPRCTSELVELRLPPRGECELELDVSGLDPDLRDVECRLVVKRAAATDERGWFAREGPASIDGTRRFRIAAPVGRYVEIARGPLFEAPATEFELVAMERTSIVLVARPR